MSDDVQFPAIERALGLMRRRLVPVPVPVVLSESTGRKLHSLARNSNIDSNFNLRKAKVVSSEMAVISVREAFSVLRRFNSQRKSLRFRLGAMQCFKIFTAEVAIRHRQAWGSVSLARMHCDRMTKYLCFRAWLQYCVEGETLAEDL